MLIGLMKMQGSRNLPMLQRQQDFKQSGHPRGRSGMSEIGFHRADGAISFYPYNGGKRALRR